MTGMGFCERANKKSHGKTPCDLRWLFFQNVLDDFAEGVCHKMIAEIIGMTAV
jgi:hypothetical protein